MIVDKYGNPLFKGSWVTFLDTTQPTWNMISMAKVIGIVPDVLPLMISIETDQGEVIALKPNDVVLSYPPSKNWKEN